MTPKEKARELVEKYTTQIFESGNTVSKQMIKQCAITTVDEILSVLDLLNKEKDAADVMDGNDMKDYWLEVKTEIEKL